MDDEGVFILQDAGEVLVVNAVGAFIVERLKADSSLDEIVDAVTERYEVELAQARADAIALVETLLEAGAIVRS